MKRMASEEKIKVTEIESGSPSHPTEKIKVTEIATAPGPITSMPPTVLPPPVPSSSEKIKVTEMASAPASAPAPPGTISIVNEIQPTAAPLAPTVLSGTAVPGTTIQPGDGLPPMSINPPSLAAGPSVRFAPEHIKETVTEVSVFPLSLC